MVSHLVCVCVCVLECGESREHSHQGIIWAQIHQISHRRVISSSFSFCWFFFIFIVIFAAVWCYEYFMIIFRFFVLVLGLFALSLICLAFFSIGSTKRYLNCLRQLLSVFIVYIFFCYCYSIHCCCCRWILAPKKTNNIDWVIAWIYCFVFEKNLLYVSVYNLLHFSLSIFVILWNHMFIIICQPRVQVGFRWSPNILNILHKLKETANAFIFYRWWNWIIR